MAIDVAKLCACGCGEEITSTRISPSTNEPVRYRRGHNVKGTGKWGLWSEPETAQRYRRENPGVWSKARRNSYLKRTYGITQNEYQEMFDEQDGVCAICGDPPEGRYLCVDHDHETGDIRSLLCHNCNAGLGNLKDDIERVRKAADYLERWQTL